MSNNTFMSSKDMPRKIPKLKLPASQNEHEIGKEIERYNSLPAGHPDRQGIYEKIQDMQAYGDWD